jgi:gliding motility-associated-like protein
MTSSGGQVYSFIHNITNSSPFTINTCALKTGPFDFQKLPLNQTFTLKVDSIKVLSGGCRFVYNNSVIFKTIALPAKTITRSLCVGDVLQVGADIYSVSKPTGISFVPAANASLCDSMITVNLTFNAASPQTDVNKTTCDQSFSLLVGSTTFNKSNPSGKVTLKNKFGCDSIVNVSLVFSTFSSGAFSFTTCDSTYTYTSGGQSFGITKQTGMVTLPGGSVAGCDSIVTINLKYLPKASSTLAFQTCDSAYQLTIGGVTFNKAKPNGQANLLGQAANGCDSIVKVNIAFLSVATSNFTISTCDESYSYKVGSKTFNKLNPSGSSVLQNSAMNGCDSIVNVQLNYSKFTFLNNIVYSCDGTDAILNLSLASHPGPYQITIDQNAAILGQSLPFTSPLKSGAHVISMLSSQGCKDTIAINVNNSNGPVVDLSQQAISNGKFQLNVNVLPNAIYGLLWNPSNSLSCSDCINPIASPIETTTYTLDFFYGNDCKDSRNITVEKVNSVVIIPNVFSPNGDGTNDKFFIQLPEKTKGIINQFKIYDRWGNLMFDRQGLEPNNGDLGWDGTYNGALLQPAVFVYYIELRLEGVIDVKKYSGSITLIK